MSSAPPTPGSITPPNEDPEKGMLDISMNQLTVVSFDIEKNKTDSTNVHTDIKSVDLPSAPKPPTAKPPTKPKKKVSKWILWQLWFNTYRYYILY